MYLKKISKIEKMLLAVILDSELSFTVWVRTDFNNLLKKVPSVLVSVHGSGIKYEGFFSEFFTIYAF